MGISDFLKIKDLRLDAYEVKLDIFDDGSTPVGVKK